MLAIRLTSCSESPRPSGFGANKRAYSPISEFLNGNVSSVYKVVSPVLVDAMRKQ